MNIELLINKASTLSYQIEVFKVEHLNYKRRKEYNGMVREFNKIIEELEFIDMKQQLLQGDEINLRTKAGKSVNIWFSKVTNYFSVVVDGECIMSSKAWRAIENKLKELGIKNNDKERE